MEKISSFQVDHLRLKPGVYVSRKDKYGDVVITTFDLRVKEPNKEPVMDQPALHTIEHLCATFLRSHKDWSGKVIYFGPMGCRTGFYVIMEGDYSSGDIVHLLIEMFEWIDQFEGSIPGATAGECGNWRDQNIDMAKLECRKYHSLIKNAKKENLEYPADLV
ncbi:MAG: S-ribosylhomocysteine lyase [Treponema sp.]|jgi:S-ribosylhomocysteine lyase|nr:S-ribosylhomocysteine lyase [Treponema sp.]